MCVQVNGLLDTFQQAKLKHADEILQFHAAFQHLHDSCARVGRDKKPATPGDHPHKT